MSGLAEGTAKQAGGAAMAPLSYINPTYREPSSSAGSHALYSEPGLARPSMNATGGSRASTRRRTSRRTSRRSRASTRASTSARKMKSIRKHIHTRRSFKQSKKGGFFPPVSALGSFMQSAPRLAVPAAVTGYRMVRNYNKRNKSRKN